MKMFENIGDHLGVNVGGTSSDRFAATSTPDVTSCIVQTYKSLRSDALGEGQNFAF